MENFKSFETTNTDVIFGGDLIVTFVNDYYDTDKKRIIYIEA